MGTNSSKYDRVAASAKKSTKQLNAERIQFEKHVEKYPEHSFMVEHLGFIKMVLAERIGKKK